jgi:hypothetical protein
MHQVNNGNDTHRLSKTLRSASENFEILLPKIQKEKNAGRVAGPIRKPPFHNFIRSPLGLVPKKNEGEYRTIHHLSYPKGSSVNDGIPSGRSISKSSEADLNFFDSRCVSLPLLTWCITNTTLLWT